MATITKGIKLSEFASMPEQEKKIRVDALFQAAVNPTPEQLREQKNEIDSEIRFFESRYQISSDKMKKLLINGEIKETADICSWLMLLKIRGSFENEHKSSQS